jgi:hypothetical protein
LASFVERVFFRVEVDEVSFGSSSSFSLMLQAVFGKVLNLAAREAIIGIPCFGIGYIGLSPPLFF